jgi:hypothetical protein
MSPPPSGSNNTLLATGFTLVSCLAHSLNLKMEAMCSSETLVDFQWTTPLHIPEDITLKFSSFSAIYLGFDRLFT